MRRLALLLVISLLTQTFAVGAQSVSHFCVRSFEDRNANQVRDDGEPLLTTGIGADLLESNGIVVASALLAESPSAAQGIICFEGLTPGQYTIQVTSAEYAATTPHTMTVTLVGDELPSVLEFGAQSIDSLFQPPLNTETETGPDWQRIARAGLGAVIALLVMQVVGFIIYLIAFRGRGPAPQPDAPALSDTAQFRRPDLE